MNIHQCSHCQSKIACKLIRKKKTVLNQLLTVIFEVIQATHVRDQTCNLFTGIKVGINLLRQIPAYIVNSFNSAEITKSHTNCAEEIEEVWGVNRLECSTQLARWISNSSFHPSNVQARFKQSLKKKVNKNAPNPFWFAWIYIAVCSDVLLYFYNTQ